MNVVHRGAVFFLPFSRVWELGRGAALAILVRDGCSSSRAPEHAQILLDGPAVPSAEVYAVVPQFTKSRSSPHVLRLPNSGTFINLPSRREVFSTPSAGHLERNALKKTLITRVPGQDGAYLA